MANSVDPDEMLHSAASHLGLHCLLRPVCLKTIGNYCNLNFPTLSYLKYNGYEISLQTLGINIYVGIEHIENFLPVYSAH